MGGLVLVNDLVRALEGGSDRFRLCRRLGRRLGVRPVYLGGLVRDVSVSWRAAWRASGLLSTEGSKV